MNMPTAVTNQATLDRIISSVGQLPASPAIVSAVMGLTSDLNTNLDEITKVLSADQTLSAKVLKLSNSSYYGRPKGVASLDEAILILGFFTVRSMVVATSAHNMYKKNDAEGPDSKLWRHSLSTALAARQIARHIKHPGKEEIFIGALMHDIGKLVMLQQLHEQYQAVVTSVETDHLEFCEVEQETLGFNHCDVAAVLLEEWSFPQALTEAICQHHHLPEYAGEGPVSMAHVINLGNFMAKKMDVGFADYKIENLAELESAQAMALNAETLHDIFESFKDHYQTEISIFEEA